LALSKGLAALSLSALGWQDRLALRR